MSMQIVNILDLISAIGEEAVQELLSDFSCPKNPEVEGFVRNNAIGFSKQKMSVTHCVMDEGRLVAIFALTHKAVEVAQSSLSSTARKKIERFARVDESSGFYHVSAFLIAQFGKNYSEDASALSGNTLMQSAIDVLKKVQHDVGGGIVYLECEDNAKLLQFYTNDTNCYRQFGERFANAENVKYIQLLRFF